MGKTKAGVGSMFLAVVALAFIAPAQAATWKCTAKQLVNYSYDGGGYAMIHLRPYSSGGRYPVTKTNSSTVKGKTKDGTSFTCKKQK